MSTFAFTLILCSALMHALWNLLVKRSKDKTVFIWWMFVTSGGLMILTLPLAGPFPLPSWRVVGLSTVGAVCFMLYHLFTGRAYRNGDLSLI
jgi:drug/metabolite transporter (DMT)-like permease